MPARLTKEIRQEFARRGGKARARKLTKADRVWIAKNAAAARWKKNRSAVVTEDSGGMG